MIRPLLPFRNRFIKESALHVHRLQKFLALWQPQWIFLRLKEAGGKGWGKMYIRCEAHAKIKESAFNNIDMLHFDLYRL